MDLGVTTKQFPEPYRSFTKRSLIGNSVFLTTTFPSYPATCVN